jgi:protein-S-isoprenylcysteine O-methyltransferase Ste14
MLATIYGVLVYLLCLGSFAYAIGFVGNIAVPHSLDGPAAGSPVVALIVDVALLALFAAQHSVMARKGFKAWWTTIVPPAVERSTFVLASSVCLFLLCWYWQPIEGRVWSVTGAPATAIQAVFWAGWGVLFLATSSSTTSSSSACARCSRTSWAAASPRPNSARRSSTSSCGTRSTSAC